jgi:hypothetical protein
MASLSVDQTRAGVPFGNAQGINGRVATGLSAAGTTLGTATALTSTMNVLSTVAAGAGVSLYANAAIADEMEVYNGGANAVRVYPDSASNSINQLSAGTAMLLAVNTACKFRKVSSTQWIAFLSA